MTFANPVPGRIQGQAEPWAGTPTFRVTSTFAQHVASGRGAGIDFGNGRGGDAVLSAEAGTILANFIDPGNGARIVRVRHDSQTVTGYAHLASAPLPVWTVVARGQQIGTVGMTGATANHLHWGVNIGGVEVDGWPLLAQNQEADMSITITKYPASRTWQTKGGTLTGYRLDPAPLTNTGTFGAGSPALASAEYIIEPTPAGWPVGPYQLVLNGAMAGYLLANSQITLGPLPVPAPPAGTYTQAQLDAAVKAAATATAKAAATEAAKY